MSKRSHFRGRGSSFHAALERSAGPDEVCAGIAGHGADRGKFKGNSELKRWWIAVFVAVAAIAAVVWWTGSGDSGETVGGIETEAVDRGAIRQIVSSVGSVRALVTVEVGSQLSGQIAELHADFNSPVEAGELLARIDPQTFERRVQESEANLAVARANVEIQAASIEKAEANLANVSAEFDRQRRLVERGSVSAAALDNAEASFKSARADLAIARAQHRNAIATVSQREAALESARIDLERTEIRSPIRGVVIDRAVDLGQTVAASFSAPVLFTIAQDLTAIRVEASVDEADIGGVRAGADAEFSVDAFPDRTFSGRVDQVRLAPLEEANVVTYTVVISARNPDRRLLPGMTANVDMVTGQREDVLRVSNAAVRFRPPEGLVDAPAEPQGEGDRGAGAMDRMFDALELSEETRTRVREDIGEVMGRMRGAFMDPNADPEALREEIGERMQEVYARHLDDEQLKQLRARMAELEQTRAAVLYVENDDGAIEARNVRLGISDDRFTEVVSGSLQPDERTVTRVRAPAGRGD